MSDSVCLGVTMCVSVSIYIYICRTCNVSASAHESQFVCMLDHIHKHIFCVSTLSNLDYAVDIRLVASHKFVITFDC